MNRIFKIVAAAATLLLTFQPASAQMRMSQPLTWTFSTQQIEKDVFEIKAVGNLSEAGWHIYDMNEYKDGPCSTSLTIEGDGITPLDKAHISSSTHKGFSEIFQMEIGTCEAPVVIVQKVKAKAGRTAIVTVEWQCCNDCTCLPPASQTGKLTLKAGKRVSRQ